MSSTPGKQPASGKGQAKGVRGPGGSLRAAGSAGKGSAGKGSAGKAGARQQRGVPASKPSSPRARLERFSAPLLVRLSRTPKWLLVIGLGLMLFFGLIQTGSLTWLGVLLLGIMTLFFAWLLVIAWPVLPVNGRILRSVVVMALTLLTILKALGRM